MLIEPRGDGRQFGWSAREAPRLMMTSTRSLAFSKGGSTYIELT